MMFKRIGFLLFSFVLATAVFGIVIRVETAVSQDESLLYLPLIVSPPQPPQIITFTANVPAADPGETITLSWQTSHATTITLYHLFGGVLSTFWDVAPTGTMSYTISNSSRNSESFILYAGSDGYPLASEMLTIPLNCLATWFFAPAPDICPQDPALLSVSAEQQFEFGTMIWVAEESRIYVLFADSQFSPRWAAFADTWQEGDPVDDPSIVPPPGLYQPQRGFGLIWREEPNIRERLGWAIAPEAGGETAVQRTSYFKYNHTYLKAIDNNIWHLLPERSDWEKFTPDALFMTIGT